MVYLLQSASFSSLRIRLLTTLKARLAIIFLHATLETLLAFMNHFPLFVLMLRIKDPLRLPGGIVFAPSKRDNSLEVKVCFFTWANDSVNKSGCRTSLFHSLAYSFSIVSHQLNLDSIQMLTFWSASMGSCFSTLSSIKTITACGVCHGDQSHTTVLHSVFDASRYIFRGIGRSQSKSGIAYLDENELRGCDFVHPSAPLYSSSCPQGTILHTKPLGCIFSLNRALAVHPETMKFCNVFFFHALALFFWFCKFQARFSCIQKSFSWSEEPLITLVNSLGYTTHM